MVMMIKKRLVKVGTSLGLVIDRVVLDTLGLVEGDYVKVEIEKVKE